MLLELRNSTQGEIMVKLGNIVKQAKGLADKHGDKISGAVDKATDAVDKKTKGKYKDKLDKLDQAAQKLDRSGKGAVAGDTSAQPAPKPPVDEPPADGPPNGA